MMQFSAIKHYNHTMVVVYWAWMVRHCIFTGWRFVAFVYYYCICILILES